MLEYKMSNKALEATEYLKSASKSSSFVKNSIPQKSKIESRGNVLAMRNKFRDYSDIERGAQLIASRGRG